MLQRTMMMAGVLAALFGCGRGEEADLSAAQLGGATAEESFAALYEEVFVPNQCTGCHGEKAAGGLDMSTPEITYDQLVGVQASGRKCEGQGGVRVDPGNADESLLIHKLEGHDEAKEAVCGSPMPTSRPMKGSDIARVRAWIDQGARYN